jgi:hypothetical protein
MNPDGSCVIIMFPLKKPSGFTWMWHQKDPCHSWGTFVLTDEPLDEPPQRLKTALKKKQNTRRRVSGDKTWRNPYVIKFEVVNLLTVGSK